MDTYRALLAIAISFVIIFGYQYFFVKQPPQETAVEQTAAPAAQEKQVSGQTGDQPQNQQASSAPVLKAPAMPVQESRPAKRVVVDAPLYTATFSEAGAALESLVLKQHRETNADDSPGKQLFMDIVEGDGTAKFAWGTTVPGDFYYTLDNETVAFNGGDCFTELFSNAAKWLYR